jgi:hypothetical protein
MLTLPFFVSLSTDITEHCYSLLQTICHTEFWRMDFPSPHLRHRTYFSHACGGLHPLSLSLSLSFYLIHMCTRTHPFLIMALCHLFHLSNVLAFFLSVRCHGNLIWGGFILDTDVHWIFYKFYLQGVGVETGCVTPTLLLPSLLCSH